MDKKLNRIMESGTRTTFVILFVFTAIMAYLGHYIIAAVEAVLIAGVYIYYRRRQRRRRADIRKYVETLAYQVDETSKSSLVNFPLPMVIMRIDEGEVVWGNEQFYQIAGLHESMFEIHIADAVPGFDTRWIMEGKTVCPYDVEISGRKYNIYGNLVRSGHDQRRSLLATLFLVDITDYSCLREKYEKSRPVVAVIVVDSYEELYKGMSEAEKSVMTADIDRQIMQWSKKSNGIVRRMERDRYLFLFEQHDLVEFIAGRFSILEEMHQYKNSEGIMATLSIGVGKGEHSLAELFHNAQLSIDMALSRGGDQVVIKAKNTFEFYGGGSREVEKRTKVKSRVTANALRHLITDSSDIFIMGHKVSDLDSLGASAGMCALARKCGKTPYLVIDTANTSASELVTKLKAAPQYEHSFISEKEAILKADASALVIVLDTSRPELVDAPQLLETVQRIAVVDHHRRAASYIENAAISLHETYASSTCELVAELLQYVVSPQDVLQVEAEALLAGIFLDTKGFTIRTGVRTFEAAAYLKHLGADTVEVRRMFSGDLETHIKKYQIISTATRTLPGISVAVSDEEVERLVAAKAADELMNVSDIKAAFVIHAEHGGASISARSYGKVNVQVICERLGGGGNLTGAGAQFKDKSPREVAVMLSDVLIKYFAENVDKN